MVTWRQAATSSGFTNLWRVLAITILCVLWWKGDGNAAGIILLLLLTVLALIRWRTAMPDWMTLADQAACLVILPYWPEAGYALALPVFESMKRWKPYYLIPVLLVIAVSELTLFQLVFLGLAAFLGAVIGAWEQQANRYLREADRERKGRYELEQLKDELLQSHADVAYMAELTERHRIAATLHDHVGHELTGSLLALRAYEQLRKEGDSQADDMLAQVHARLTSSVQQLRDTVHNMAPLAATGMERIADICRRFEACPLEFQVYGDTAKVPVHVWAILEPCLKEALTNVVKHAQASHVQVTLDVSEHIARLSVRNDDKQAGSEGSQDEDGMAAKAPGTSAAAHETWGFGLRNLRRRAQAAGGNLSFSALKSSYLLVCVLPLGHNAR